MSAITQKQKKHVHSSTKSAVKGRGLLLIERLCGDSRRRYNDAVIRCSSCRTNHLTHVALSFVSGPHTAPRPSARSLCATARPTSPEAPYMARSHRSTIGCFYDGDSSVAGALSM